MTLYEDFYEAARLRQHWIAIAGGFEPAPQADPGFPGFAATRRSGTGFSVRPGTQSCWQGGNTSGGCAPIDLAAEPFGPDGNLELHLIDPALLAKRYKGGDVNNQGWPQGFGQELFQNNYLTLRAMWLAGEPGMDPNRTGEPTWQEMYDLAFTTPRGSTLYRTWLIDRNPEVSTDPAKPVKLAMRRSPHRYNWTEHQTFRVKLYNENTYWAPGQGPMYQPGYPEVLGKDPLAPPTPPPLPPPRPPVVVPPPAPPPVGLSSPEQRIEELTAWVGQKLVQVKPLLVEALVMFRKAVGRVAPLVVAALLAGCSVEAAMDSKPAPPADPNRVSLGFAGTADFVTFPDGTRCVIYDGNRSGGIDCDFPPAAGQEP